MREMEKRIRKELSAWTGVDYRLERGGKHKAFVLQARAGRRRRRLQFTATQTDRRGVLNKLTELRRVLREIGVQPA